MKFCHTRNVVTDNSRCYIDGKRVSREEFDSIRNKCLREGSYDSLITLSTPRKNLIHYYAQGRLPRD